LRVRERKGGLTRNEKGNPGNKESQRVKGEGNIHRDFSVPQKHMQYLTQREGHRGKEDRWEPRVRSVKQKKRCVGGRGGQEVEKLVKREKGVYWDAFGGSSNRKLGCLPSPKD